MKQGYDDCTVREYSGHGTESGGDCDWSNVKGNDGYGAINENEGDRDFEENEARGEATAVTGKLTGMISAAQLVGT